MNDLVRDFLPAILIALAVAAIVAFLLFRPRQKVRLTDDTPRRPHMAHALDSAKESNGIPAEIAAAASDVGGEIISAPVHDHLHNGPGGLDNFERMKGVGPKFAQMLQARGFTRFEQIARLNADEVERLDAELGPFRGRLARDRVVEQASFLARGDEDGFQQQFGKL